MHVKERETELVIERTYPYNGSPIATQYSVYNLPPVYAKNSFCSRCMRLDIPDRKYSDPINK